MKLRTYGKVRKSKGKRRRPVQLPPGHIAKRERTKTDVSPAKRAAVFERDGHRCRYCGSEENLSIDHIVPRCRGGTNALENLAIACCKCNVAKGDRTPDECGAVVVEVVRITGDATATMAELIAVKQRKRAAVL